MGEGKGWGEKGALFISQASEVNAAGSLGGTGGVIQKTGSRARVSAVLPGGEVELCVKTKKGTCMSESSKFSVR